MPATCWQVGETLVEICGCSCAICPLPAVVFPIVLTAGLVPHPCPSNWASLEYSSACMCISYGPYGVLTSLRRWYFKDLIMTWEVKLLSLPPCRGSNSLPGLECVCLCDTAGATTCPNPDHRCRIRQDAAFWAQIRGPQALRHLIHLGEKEKYG